MLASNQRRTSPSDEALAARASKDRAALAELYDRYAPMAYALALRIVPSAAEDAVHDSFVTLVNRPGSFDPARGTFRAWFMTVVHNRCLMLLRERSRLSGEEGLESVPDVDAEPVDAVVRQLEDGTVRDALGQLPAPQREALVLAYYGGLSQSAMSARLGVPLGTVKARMRRGLLALRAALGGERQGERFMEDEVRAT